jgi:serine/threonine protein kinase
MHLGFLANGTSQRLGECLGKGAFGSVYKAFNWGTGEAVAVKQIRLADLPKSELRMIEVGFLP